MTLWPCSTSPSLSLSSAGGHCFDWRFRAPLALAARRQRHLPTIGAPGHADERNKWPWGASVTDQEKPCIFHAFCMCFCPQSCWLLNVSRATSRSSNARLLETCHFSAKLKRRDVLLFEFAWSWGQNSRLTFIPMPEKMCVCVCVCNYIYILYICIHDLNWFRCFQYVADPASARRWHKAGVCLREIEAAACCPRIPLKRLSHVSWFLINSSSDTISLSS
jgi:hypothetical protein